MAPEPSLLVAALAPIEDVVTRLSVWRRVHIDRPRCLSLRRLITGEEVRHKVHHVLEFHVYLFEIFVKFVDLMILPT